MPLYQLLTDRTLAQSSAITPTTLIHIVYTGDPSQNIAGSSYKAELQQLSSIFSGGTNTLVTGGTYSDGTITFTNSSGGTFNVTGLTISGNYLPLSGGTVTGNTVFTQGLTVTTISATTYQNLPLGNYASGLTFNLANYDLSIDGGNGTLDTVSLSILASDLTVTGGTYNLNNGVVTLTNNTGGTFNISGFTTGYTDFYVTGFTYSANTFYVKNTNTTYEASINTVTGLTSTGTISSNTLSATTYQNTPTVIQIACSDEVTALVTGTTTTFRMPYNMSVSEVRGSLTTAQSAGSAFTVNILNNGTTMLSTLLTIDNTLKTSKTSAIQPVISTPNLVDDAEISISITQIGNGTARGLKVTILGKRS